MKKPGTNWRFITGVKRHTQDGPNLVSLMKDIGKGRRPVRAIDVGCGDGIIASEILAHNKATEVVAIDILRGAIEAAEHNLAEYIADGKAFLEKLSAARFFSNRRNYDTFDRFVINPPFFAEGSGRSNKNIHDQLARHDGKLNLHLWTRGARRLLKTGGELYCVFPTERLAELMSQLSDQKVEPKEIWWFRQDTRKRRFFLRAVKGARPGLIVHF